MSKNDIASAKLEPPRRARLRRTKNACSIPVAYTTGQHAKIANTKCFFENTFVITHSRHDE